MKQIVYIVALKRSGSTALDMLLGTLPGYVSFGETTNAFSRIAGGKAKWPCSCGADLPACPVWSAVAKAIRRPGNDGMAEWYRSLLAIADRQFGNGVTVVDSSKRLDTLFLLHERYGDWLKVIFLVRDVRSHLSSRLRGTQVDLRTSVGKFGAVLGLLPMWLVELMDWVVRNGRIALLLRRHGIEHLRMGYDELGADRDGMSRLLLDFLGEQGAALDFSYGAGTHRIFEGNKFFLHGDRSRGFRYSGAWKAREVPAACALALRVLGGLNRALVYSNTAPRKIP